MRRWRWSIACLIGGIIYVGLYYSNDVIRQAIIKIVYNTNDFAYIGQLFLRDQEMIVTSTQPLAVFTEVKRYGEGFLVTYSEEMQLTAQARGVIVFTGHTARMGKVMSIAYDNGVTMTFGWMDDFYHLPYSEVQQGEVIGFKRPGELYVKMERYGQLLTLEQMVQWLRYD